MKLNNKYKLSLSIIALLIISLGLVIGVQRKSPSTISKAQDEPTPIICENAKRLVPSQVLSSAIVDPWKNSTWVPPKRIYLTVLNEHIPFDVISNPVLFRTHCETPNTTPDPEYSSIRIDITVNDEQASSYTGFVYVELCKTNDIIRKGGISCDKSDIRKVKITNGIGKYEGKIDQYVRGTFIYPHLYDNYGNLLTIFPIDTSYEADCNNYGYGVGPDCSFQPNDYREYPRGASYNLKAHIQPDGNSAKQQASLKMKISGKPRIDGLFRLQTCNIDMVNENVFDCEYAIEADNHTYNNEYDFDSLLGYKAYVIKYVSSDNQPLALPEGTKEIFNFCLRNIGNICVDYDDVEYGNTSDILYDIVLPEPSIRFSFKTDIDKAHLGEIEKKTYIRIHTCPLSNQDECILERKETYTLPNFKRRLDKYTPYDWDYQIDGFNDGDKIRVQMEPKFLIAMVQPFL